MLLMSLNSSTLSSVRLVGRAENRDNGIEGAVKLSRQVILGAMDSSSLVL